MKEVKNRQRINKNLPEKPIEQQVEIKPAEEQGWQLSPIDMVIYSELMNPKYKEY